MFWPILLKTVVYTAEAAGCKGVTLFHIPKGKGDTANCSASRAIAVQSCFSKALQRALRPLLVSKVEEHAPDMMLGGRKGRTALFGCFAVRSFMRSSRQRGISAAAIFFDIASAYYAVIRELLVGRSDDAVSVEELAQGLRLTTGEMQAVASMIDDEPVLADADSPFLRRLVQEIGSATWFVLARDDTLVHTRRGTRPGGPIADVLFSALFLRVLARRHDSSHRPHVPTVPWDGRRTLDSVCYGDSRPIEFGDTIFADDLAVCVQGSDASRIGAEVCQVAGAVFDAFGSHGLTPSMGATKTAAIVAPVSKGARRARHLLYHERAGSLRVFRELAGVLDLTLVSQYKHLGGVVTHAGTMSVEINRRLSLASKGCFPGGQAPGLCVQGCGAGQACQRGRVLSVLLHGAGAWAELLEGEAKTLSAGYVSLCRQLLCIGRAEDPRWTSSQILAAVALPGVDILVSAERLRFLLQMVRGAPDVMWALAKRDPLFLRAQWDALCLLYGKVGSTTTLPSPDRSWYEWECFMKRALAGSKGLSRGGWLSRSRPSKCRRLLRLPSAAHGRLSRRRRCRELLIRNMDVYSVE